MSNRELLVPLPPTLYVIGIEGDGYSEDRCTMMPAWDDDAMHTHAAAQSAADNAALRERVIQLEEELDNTQEQLHHTIQSQKFWFKAACDAGWESDQA